MMTVLTLALGAVAYGVHVRASTLVGLIVMLLLGMAAFTMLGIGATRFIPTAESAPVFVNLSILPLTFISSIWFPTDGMASWLPTIAKVVPDQSLADGLQYAFDPRTASAGLKGEDVRTLLIWCGRDRVDDPLPAPAAGRHGMKLACGLLDPGLLDRGLLDSPRCAPLSAGTASRRSRASSPAREWRWLRRASPPTSPVLR